MGESPIREPRTVISIMRLSDLQSEDVDENTAQSTCQFNQITSIMIINHY